MHETNLDTSHTTMQKLVKCMQSAVSSNELVDISGEYKIVQDITCARDWITMLKDNKKVILPGVTLATQCSVNHLYHLVTLIKYWDGPVSIAVFAVSGHIQVAVETIALLHRCINHIQRNVSFNLVLPLSDRSNIFSKEMDSKLKFSSCDDIDQYLFNHFKNFDKNYDLNGVKYPNNLLRNVAVDNSNTDHVMVIDIDMIPSFNLYSEFLRILQQQQSSKISNIFESKTAYVIPSFEMLQNAVVPQDKSKLLNMWKKHEARPFYNELCWKCQHYTDYKSWRNLTITTELRVAYEVAWRDPWEPFYIADVRMPRYDERFRQYGFNRISQVSFDLQFIDDVTVASLL